MRLAHDALSELKVDPLMYLDVIGRAFPAQRLVAEAHDFNIRFDDWLYPRDLDFAWRGNVRVALRGANGSGKTTLLKAVLGDPFHHRGAWRCGNLVALYVDQARGALNDAATVFDNIRAVSTCSDIEIRNQLARFLFANDAVFQPVHELSGGERLRAALARGLLASSTPELMLLDEPTNNLDVANTEFLARLVREFRGAVILISHDERFVADCAIDEQFDVDAM